MKDGYKLIANLTVKETGEKVFVHSIGLTGMFRVQLYPKTDIGEGIRLNDIEPLREILCFSLDHVQYVVEAIVNSRKGATA